MRSRLSLLRSLLLLLLLLLLPAAPHRASLALPAPQEANTRSVKLLHEYLEAAREGPRVPVPFRFHFFVRQGGGSSEDSSSSGSDSSSTSSSERSSSSSSSESSSRPGPTRLQAV